MEFKHPAYPADYNPREPYITIKGETLELKMFSDYQNLLWQYNQALKKAVLTGYQKHLIWLLQRGEDREIKMICRHCNKHKVAYFTYFKEEEVLYANSLKEVRCEACSYGREHQLPFKFSSLRHFHVYGQTNFLHNILPLFSKVFSLPARKTKEFAFTFFKTETTHTKDQNNIKEEITQSTKSPIIVIEKYNNQIPIAF